MQFDAQLFDNCMYTGSNKAAGKANPNQFEFLISTPLPTDNIELWIGENITISSQSLVKTDW